MATPSSAPLPLTGDDFIDAAIHGYYWELDSSRTINWSLADGYLGEIWTAPSFTSSLLDFIFTNISSYADVQFNYVGHYTDPSDAYFFGSSDITISLDGSGIIVPDTALAIGEFPDASQGVVDPGDIFFNANLTTLHDSPVNNYLGSDGFALALHEIGHALGLKHPHDDGGNGFPTFEELGWGAFDTDLYTVMSYNNNNAANPMNMMVLDVLALQYLYGKNNTTNATDNTYYLSANYIQTIWDAGGTDTVDVSPLANTMTVGWNIYLPDSQWSVLVDTKVGSAQPASEASLPSPFTFYWLMGDIENVNGSSFDDTLVGNDFSNSLIGNAGDDFLDGGVGNDTLDGGLGTDTMIGGLGNDTYYAGVGDTMVENANEGTDLVYSTMSWTLGANIENLTLYGTGAVNGTGNSLNNTLTGNSAANVLMGGAGHDIYNVGTGDTVVEAVNEGTDLVLSNVTWTLGANTEKLTLLGTGAINGTGNSLNNTILGNSAANLLMGGAGHDIYNVGTGDTVVEAVNEGTDLVLSNVTWTLGANIEKLTLLGTGAINGTGNSLNNTILGNSAANLLTGGAGNDTLAGRLGNDTYLVDRSEGRDTISENDGTVGNSDLLLYGATINPLDLFLSQQANSLRIAIHGSTDYVTIQNWFSAPTTAQVEMIQAGNGQTLVNTEVNQLIQAMATFSQQTGLTWDQGIDQQPQQVEAVLAASWQ
jgi:Ca2+-binding RTX toxin-like protein